MAYRYPSLSPTALKNLKPSLKAVDEYVYFSPHQAITPVDQCTATWPLLELVHYSLDKDCRAEHRTLLMQTSSTSGTNIRCR